jgi:ATP-dependent DNA helicase RecG
MGTIVSEPDRARRLAAWSDPVARVRFVDAPRAEMLERMGIVTVEDLLRHYPNRYLDLSSTVPLASLRIGQEVTAVGTVHEVTVKRPRPKLSVTEAALFDGTGLLVGVWFNQSYLAGRFKVGEKWAFAGKVTMEFGTRQMRNPFVERLGDDAAATMLGRILPIHPATEGLSTNWVRRLVREALDAFADVPDPLPSSLRIGHGLVSLRRALQEVHFPSSGAARDAARRRLAYDELLAIQLGMALRRHSIVDERPGHRHAVEGPALAALRGALPFELTTDQEGAVTGILSDMASPRPMNRLLLGDVGTGKTAVAALALACVADSGTQAAMMAPTEVLAAQYAGKVGPLLDAAGIPWALLTGSTPAKRRREILAALADGSLTVAFGTHALLVEDVAFSRLTLAIVDEQHRFGVGQRLGLRGKGEAVDLLVMTATPIPRSLALTLYGDLDTSYIRQRPGGRDGTHVTTSVVAKTGREGAYGRVRAAVADGHQAYVVCALVDESDTAEAKAATKEAERLRTKVLPDLKVGLLTGQMKPAEKTEAMEAFRAGAIDVLVATTVIEVGVDVPNATVMLVEDAERFGLAQLHQLRGRVGRGAAPGEFLLFADPKTDDGRRRMAAIAAVNDGFALAEEDLRLRGEGQVLGERQSGLPELRIASVLRDADLLDAARADAAELVAADPRMVAPEHVPLLREVVRRFGADWEWVSSG